MEIKKMSELYADRLKDESRMTGTCDTFSISSSVDELQDIARTMWSQEIPITVQGAMTGICGCAVPAGGHVISTEKLNRIIGYRKYGSKCFVTLEPGVRLADLRAFCRQNAYELSGYTFLPNPSETLATLGGMFACNAKGLNSRLHGGTVDAVNMLKLTISSGVELEIRRGDCVFDENGCDITGLGRLEIENLSKNNSTGKGLAFAHFGSDLIDVIGGSEGMLAIVTELELELKKPASERWGVMFFFDDKLTALDFSERAISRFENDKTDCVSLGAAEYLDAASMMLVNNYKQQVTLLKSLPDFPAHAKGSIYLELEGDSAKETELVLEELLDLFACVGGKEEDTWAADGEEEIEKFRRLRHAIPEAVNFEIDKIRQSDTRIIKLCTDLEIPDMRIGEAESLYSSLLLKSGLNGVVFGHVYSKRLHFNIISRNYEEYVLGTSLIAELINKLAVTYGCITWENGIGKTKKELFNLLTDQHRHTAEAIKKFFDEKGLLNPGNML